MPESQEKQNQGLNSVRKLLFSDPKIVQSGWKLGDKVFGVSQRHW